MEKLYIVFVDTPGIFAAMIRRVVKMNYVHVVLSLDEKLTQAYSIGRRDPACFLFAGFEKENLHKIYKQFPTAKYKITYLECTKEQKTNIEKQLLECYEKQYDYHYCRIGLPFLLFKKPFYQKNHYTCSSFTSKILEENGISLFNKHFSLVTPRDFFDLNLPTIYECPLSVLAEGTSEIEFAEPKRSSHLFTLKKKAE